MPNPKKNESEQDFVSRGMGDKEAQKSFPDEKQRLAFLYSRYREKKGVSKTAVELNPLIGLVVKGGPGSGRHVGSGSGPWKTESSFNGPGGMHVVRSRGGKYNVLRVKLGEGEDHVSAHPTLESAQIAARQASYPVS